MANGHMIESHGVRLRNWRKARLEYNQNRLRLSKTSGSGSESGRSQGQYIYIWAEVTLR